MDKKKGDDEKNQPLNGLLKKVDREKGFRRASEFLLLLQKENAGKILAQLSPEEVEGITKEIIDIKGVNPQEAKKVLAEFGMPAPPPDERREEVKGGLETAEMLLTAALGEDRALEILKKVEPRLAPELCPAPEPFDFLDGLDAKALGQLFVDEAPTVIALVLAYAAPGTGSLMLKGLALDIQKDVVQRVAKMSKLLPEVIRRTADVLKKKLFTQSDFSSQYIDGRSKLRDILKHMDLGQERTILDSLSEEKPEIASALERELFTMELFKKVPRKDLQSFLREVVDRDIAMMLKGESDELKSMFWDAVSERRKTGILEESELIGQVPKSEVEKVQQLVLEVLRKKIDAGQIVLEREDDRIIP